MSSETGPARRLWLYNGPPGMTPDLVQEEAVRLGFKMHEAALGLREVDWLALRDACFARCGIVDAEAWQRDRIVESAGYKRWRSELVAYQRAKGYAA
jgi:hypothetical protein